jgi:hypothetical protein
MKEEFQENNPSEEWIVPTKPLDWASPKIELTQVRRTFIHAKLTRGVELNSSFEKYRSYIMNLPDNWDGNGAPSFTENTFERASFLLKNILNKLWNNMDEIPIPLIQPVPDGSIDINWETDKFELLINISPETNKQVNVYGEKIDSPEDEIEMYIPYDLAELGVIQWLKKIL